MPVPPSGHISPFNGFGTPQHASAGTSPRIIPQHQHAAMPSIQVSPEVATDGVGSTPSHAKTVGSESVDPRDIPISSISVTSAQTARAAEGPGDLARGVSERVEDVKKGPGGGPGSFGSGGAPGSGGSNAPRADQPLRIMETHVDPSS